MLKERHAKVLSYYSRLHSHRREWFNAKLRLAAMLVAVAALWFAYKFFEVTYPVAITDASGNLVVVSGLLFNSFVAGALFGAVLIAIIIEGEYLLGLRKIVYALEEPNKKAKPARKGRK